jgi:DNA-binding response OmpR family regulator
MRPAREASDPAALIAAMQARIDDLEAIVEELTALPPDWHDLPGRLGVKLSPCESAVMGLLLRARPRIVTRTNMLAAMSMAPGATGEAEPKVVDVIICHLRRKLASARGRPRIVTAWGVGYSLEMDEPAGAS